MSFPAELSASAPGKIILLGEHAVVYGQPALAVPVSGLRATVTIEPSDQSVIVAKDLQRQTPLNLTNLLRNPLAKMAAQTAEALGVGIPVARYVIASTIPLASGLGSGAAVSAALGRAVALAAGQEISHKMLNDLVFSIEKMHHGTPSGVDNTVVVYEMPVYFIRGRTPQVLDVGQPMTLLIGDSGIAAPTRRSVGDVLKLVKLHPAGIEPVIQAIGQIVRAGREAVSRGDLTRLGQLMNADHALLQALTVSDPVLDQLVDAARSAGALGAKLSGGGRGGNMIALVTPNAQTAVAEALLKAGARHVYQTTLEPTQAIQD